MASVFKYNGWRHDDITKMVCFQLTFTETKQTFVLDLLTLFVYRNVDCVYLYRGGDLLQTLISSLQLPHQQLGRLFVSTKNWGYLYAIRHGAQYIYETQENIK